MEEFGAMTEEKWKERQDWMEGPWDSVGDWGFGESAWDSVCDWVVEKRW